MSFVDRLKEARLKKGMTQEQIALKVGVAKSTFTGYEKGNSEPNMITLSKIMNALQVDANFLWQDEMDFPMSISYNEMEHIKKYRALDDSGKFHADSVLEWESKRTESLANQAARIAELEATHKQTAMEQAAAIIDYERATSNLYLYAYMGKIACAGTGFYFDDIPIDTLEAPYMEDADFIIGVNGDSMESDYQDGDKLYIKKTEKLIYGEVGIFTVNNECFLKEYGNDGLVSRNPKYNDIPGTEDVRLIGKVLGRVDEK